MCLSTICLAFILHPFHRRPSYAHRNHKDLTTIPPTPPSKQTVSSEVECVVQSLSLIASVELLDIYALVGPMDTFDYRHVSKVQGLPLEGLPGLYSFPIDASAIPRERVWQLQLKLSSSAQGVTTVDIHELSVVVESLGGPGITGAGAGGAGLATTTMLMADLDLNKSKGGSSMGATMTNSSNNSNVLHTARSLGGSTSMRTTATATMGRGMSASDADANLNSSRSSTLRQPSSPGMGGRSSRGASSSSSSSTSSSSRVHSSTASKLSRSTDLSATAIGRSGGPTHDLAVRGGSSRGGGGGGGGGDGALVSQSQQGNALMQQETAAVASVLNAVCEKMVGVVSEKTKAYLAKAGKRTEKRVLDKMAKLEERIEKFDHVLEHATISSREIEQALLALDKDLSSPRKPMMPVVPVGGAEAGAP